MGLGCFTNNFLIDDIAFEGITYDEGVADGILSVDSPATVKYEEYFDVAGRRIRPGDVSKGVIIRRSHLTDRRNGESRENTEKINPTGKGRDDCGCRSVSFPLNEKNKIEEMEK